MVDLSYYVLHLKILFVRPLALASVSNTVLMKLEYGSVDFSCEQHFKKNKSMPVRQKQAESNKRRCA